MTSEFRGSRTRFVTFIVAIITLTAGCSTTTDGLAIPNSVDSRPSETTTSESTPSEAPAVEDPVNVSAFLQHPCTTLTQEQLSRLDVSGTGAPTTSGGIAEQVGPYCVWLAPERSASLSVGFLASNEIGLTTVYESRDEFAYFDPTSVGGYPAVFADFDDYRNDGECSIIVGTSDTETFRASEKGELNPQDACDRAKQIATAALATMSGG